MRIYHCKNEGPFCGCWADGWVVALPTATDEQIEERKEACADELSQYVYELCVDENEYDSVDEEEMYYERDDEIAAESSCSAYDFDAASVTLEELQSYGLMEMWNLEQTAYYLISY